MSDFDQIATLQWKDTEPPLDSLWNVIKGWHDRIDDKWQERPADVVCYRLFNRNGLVPCNICGYTDRWTIEREAPRVFICEHIWEAWREGLPIRKFDSKTLDDIISYEIVTDLT